MKEREHWEVLGIGGYTILKLIFIFYTVHCNATIEHKATNCTFSELIF
jgi:hypothetical protein